jgi:signal transduction histidine kinase
MNEKNDWEPDGKPPDMDMEVLRKELDEKDGILRKTDAALKALYAELEGVNASLEEMVQERTRQLEASNHRLGEELKRRREAERRLRQYSEGLERTVDERDHQLHEARETILQQERLALIGKLAGGIGHELRTPLGAIRNVAYFLGLAIEAPDPEVREALGILEKEVQNSDRIIHSLMDFAREKKRPYGPVDVRPLLTEALERVSVPETVRVEGPPDISVPRISGDYDQLSRVFENLVRNAVEAMPDGGRLDIQMHVRTSAELVVVFQDTGTGIPEDLLEGVFQPLFSTKPKGVGLGLALVRMIVEAHGGTVEVESEEGRGTTFRVVLPIKGKASDSA